MNNPNEAGERMKTETAGARPEMLQALKTLAYWSWRVNALQHAGLTILPSSWSELHDATNRANAIIWQEEAA